MLEKSAVSQDESQVIALKALVFLMGEPDRANRFMGVTGATPESIRAGAGEQGFLRGVLEYLCGDEPLLLVFAESAGIAPESVDAAARHLENA